MSLPLGIVNQNITSIRRFHSDKPEHDHDHSKCGHDHSHDHVTPKEEELDSNIKEQLQMFDDFKEAVDYLQKGNLVAAHDRFKRVQEILKNVNQEKSQNYLYITNQIAHLSMKMYQFQDAEVAFNSCLDISQELTENPEVIYKHYHNLFTFYIKSNLKQAILLGKALLSEQERQDIPIANQKEFLLNLGTAYL